jgi:hypothetical protein
MDRIIQVVFIVDVVDLDVIVVTGVVADAIPARNNGRRVSPGWFMDKVTTNRYLEGEPSLAGFPKKRLDPFSDIPYPRVQGMETSEY